MSRGFERSMDERMCPARSICGETTTRRGAQTQVAHLIGSERMSFQTIRQSIPSAKEEAG